MFLINYLNFKKLNTQRNLYYPCLKKNITYQNQVTMYTYIHNINIFHKEVYLISNFLDFKKKIIINHYYAI